MNCLLYTLFLVFVVIIFCTVNPSLLVRVVMAGTDGLFDNLFDEEIAALVVKSHEENRHRRTAKRIARALANAAIASGSNRTRSTPFAADCARAGIQHSGGKVDRSYRPQPSTVEPSSSSTPISTSPARSSASGFPRLPAYPFLQAMKDVTPFSSLLYDNMLDFTAIRLRFSSSQCRLKRLR